LQKQLQSKQRILKCHIEPGNQTQTYIFGLPIAEGSNRQEGDRLIEHHNKLQETIDVLTKTEESNNRTIQELREKEKQLQANITGQTKAMESLKQAVNFLCGEQKDVSTRKLEAITTIKWAENPPAINIARLWPNNVGL
jgi:predicted RNase H-like nuclease (RuvC/YqgF family)